MTVTADGKPVCHDVNLTINDGETHILLGPNGSGKSSLLCALMGIRPFDIVGGTALYCGQDLTAMSLDERARAGVGMAFQRPPSLTGVTVKQLIAAMQPDPADSGTVPSSDPVEKLGLTHLLDRDINKGFSGGEAKRWEIAKLTTQSPRLCLFDEPESGVDIEQVKVVAGAISELMNTPLPDGKQRAAIIITHTGFILDGIDATIAHLLIDGRIQASDDAKQLFNHVRRRGYAAATLS
ncbi:ABC transporter ATP-binding protein [Corynebacterium sp. LK2510]|uniref:ABC transporter ATP-binding protein n=1 Tax=Corynebacterium sp. LK2510 TaxID=3110472 RepID=UPI002A9BF41F|nr:ATP-binding cassette domain-containing protein [Corynebacterium sp.]